MAQYSIFKRKLRDKNNVPYFMYYLKYTDKNGHIRHKSTGCKNRKEANEFYRNFNSAVIKDHTVRISDMKRKALEYAGINTSLKTQSAYHNCLTRFEEYLQNDKLANISETDIQNYIGYRNGNKYSMNIEIAIIKKAFKIACDKKWIQDNPARNIKKFNVKSPVKEFTLQQKEMFLAELKECGNINYYYAAVIAFETGMRKAEICNLTWNQIENDRVNLGNKIDNAAEYAYLNDKAIEILQILKLNKIRSINNYVFGNPLNQRNLTRTFNRVRAKLGFSNYIRFHSTRHTAVTKWANELPLHIAQALARHRDIKTTMNYVHTNEQQLKDAVNK